MRPGEIEALAALERLIASYEKAGHLVGREPDHLEWLRRRLAAAEKGGAK